MSKRGADKELTDRNWDDEEEPEDPGVFQQATSNILQERVIVKGKRRGTTTSGTTESTGAGAFKGFGGFTGFGGASKTGSTPGTGFSFGQSSSKPFSLSDSNGSSGQPSMVPSGLFAKETSPKSNGASSKQESNGTGSRYFAELTALNQSVTKWIKQHVDKDPLCILTPIFKDYEKHLENIKIKYPKESKDTEEDQSTSEDKNDEKQTEPASSGGLFKTGGSTGSSLFGSKNTSSASTSFSFQSTTSAISSFSSSSTGGSTGVSSGFSFKPTGGATEAGDNKGFSFAINKPSTSEAGSENASASGEGDEEYVPPQAEVKEVSEEDAFYTKRCKLFYKKDSNWVEKGVGNLHLKELDDGKTQLLIRADTNLGGNILLNIRLSPSVPASQQGKNNVCIVCVPHPPIDTKEDSKKPTSMLIRVKTKEDAEELFQKIEEAKGAQS